MKDYVHHLKLECDFEELKKEIKQLKVSPYNLRDKNNWDESLKAKWRDKELNVRHRKTSGYIDCEGKEINRIVEYFKNILNCEIKPVYTIQRKNTELPMHRDSEVMLASINILLEDNYIPITFEDIGEVNYKIALINISKYHMVKSQDIDRELLKLCIFNKSFNECKELLNRGV
tara:strand:- start:230 stop:751 length:522 start_codon:yes stop_codon:yes gene_type:complete